MNDNKSSEESCCSGGISDFKPNLPPALLTAEHGEASISASQPDIEFITIPAGAFAMGSEDFDSNPLDNEGPVRQVWVDEFEIGATPITNLEFAQFTEDSAYETEAERVGWSFVFHLQVADDAEVLGESRGAGWWYGVGGASWRSPAGGGSTYLALPDHPVVHISYKDALAYCQWAGMSLPTEEQWEKAARGGLVSRRFPWGDDLLEDGKLQCNIFQGEFPNSVRQGSPLGTSAVKSFQPNGFGGYDFAGNVWEWTVTDFTSSPGMLTEPNDALKITRGGSYLCHDSYCNRYRVGARNKAGAATLSGNIGFRVVRR